MSLRHAIFPILLVVNTFAHAGLQVSNVFDNNMVIQRDKPIRVWGMADAGTNVQVILGERDLTVRADDSGKWLAELDPLAASALPRRLTVRSDDETVEYDGILIGDIWLLGGQSNMEDVLESIYHGDTEVASANHPHIRLMTVPQVAGPEPVLMMDRLNEFNSWTGRHEQKGSWHPCTPKSVARFSAIGYVFGRRLHLVSGVPIGLIDASLGGTTAEAWTSRSTLGDMPAAKPLLSEWDAKVASYDPEASLRRRIENWERSSERRKREGKPPRAKPTEPEPDPAGDRNNPGGSFHGMICPLADLNIKGAIFNQGYNNALGHNSRPGLYAEVFKAMVTDWRKAFRDETLPFGIVALTAGGEPQTLENFEQRMIDPAPFIREAQAQAWQQLEHVGFAPAYDQQVPWYHPHKKFELGERIARWALHEHYDQKRIGWQPAVCTEWKVVDERIELKFDRNVRVHDGRPFSGFAIAGDDRHFYPANAEFVVIGKDNNGRDRRDESRVAVSHPLVKDPVSVRYAWARNPLGNAVNAQHHERTIPVVSFRTDDWDWPEAPYDADGDAVNQYRRGFNERRNEARERDKDRKVAEAKLVLQSAAE